MQTNIFQNKAALPDHPDWALFTSRVRKLDEKEEDPRTPFERDYTRVLHSMAYRRLKHKTQVFYNIDNDHICTRMEHVSHVESVSSTIASELGLNAELTRAIATAHDLGHAPFGHHGESVLRELSYKTLGKDFWHEQNGLRFVDHIELLEDSRRMRRNLDLTYAVRDGIISHCGEVDENGLFPRDSSVPPEAFTSPGQYNAATWEGCVVKLADKIAYIGRDIEDAMRLGFIDKAAEEVLREMAEAARADTLNTTVIVHSMILDVCRESSPEKGIALSAECAELLRALKAFNYEHIYTHPRLRTFEKYGELVLRQIFDTLLSCFDGDVWQKTVTLRHAYPRLADAFQMWLSQYVPAENVPAGDLREIAERCGNEKVYADLSDPRTAAQAVIDFVSGMTDRFAITVFEEMLRF